MGLAPLKGSCERGKVPLHWKPPSLAGRSAGTDKELQRLTGEWGRWLVAGRAEREQLRRSLSHHCTSQPKRHICWYVQQLGAETQASVDRPWERTWFGWAETTWRAWDVVQAATGGVHRTEPSSAIGATLLTQAQGEGCGPTIEASFSVCLQLAQLSCYELWAHVSTGGLPTHGGRAEIWADSQQVHDFRRFTLAAVPGGHLSWLLCSHSWGESSASSNSLSQQECSSPTYLTPQLRTGSGNFYCNNWEADPAPDRAVTTIEQSGGPAQHPVQALVTTTPVHPLLRG